MDINMKELCFLSEAKEFSNQALNEAKLSPPPTLPDIKQILMADSRARILSAEPTHSRILMDGTVVYTICYLSIMDTCCSFSATAAFKTTMETGGVLPDSVLSVGVNVLETESVQGGPREVYLKSTIEINATAINNQRQVALDSNDANIISKSTLKNMSFIREVKTRIVPVREDITLNQDIDDVVYSFGYTKSCSVLLDERAAIVSGDIVVNSLLRTTDETDPIFTNTQIIPFEQMFNIDQIFDGDFSKIEATIDELNVFAIENEKQLLSIEAMLNLKLVVCGRDEVSVTCDAYSQKSIIEVTKQRHIHTFDMFSESSSQDAEFTSDFQGADNGSAVVILKPFVLWKKCSDESISLEGMVDIYAFYMQGATLMCRKVESPFTYELPLGGLCEDSRAVIRCGVRDAVGDISGGKLNVRCKLDFLIQVYSCETVEVAVSATDTGEDTQKNIGVFIYFASGSDTSFDVAKKYLVSEGQIAKYNPDISENLYAGQKVLIISN